MTTTINASTSAGLVQTADTSGVLALQTAGTTAISIGSNQNVNFAGTAQRITGDFTNATIANRVSFQTSTTNSVTSVAAIPNGTSAAANFRVLNASDPTNSSFIDLNIGSTVAGLTSSLVGTGTYLPMTFTTGGSERVRIDTSGNVGIGTASPSTFPAKFAVSGFVASGGQNYSAGFSDAVNSTFRIGHQSGLTNLITDTAMAFYTSSTERMRIDSSGIVQIGGTTARTTQAKLELTSATNTALSFYMYKTSQVEMAMGFKSSTDSNFYIGTGSSSVGTNGVYLTNTGNSWNAVSDERMKTIVEPIENASEKVSSLRAVIGYYNNDESQTRRPFLIAQDVQQVLPEAVNVQDIETGTLGMSYTDTIPLLVAAIKEQQALITQLQADVAALKGATQ